MHNNYVATQIRHNYGPHFSAVTFHGVAATFTAVTFQQKFNVIPYFLLSIRGFPFNEVVSVSQFPAIVIQGWE